MFWLRFLRIEYWIRGGNNVRTWQIVLLVITALLLVALVVLYFVGKKLQKKKDESDRQL